jgi:hypothetical protein
MKQRILFTLLGILIFSTTFGQNSETSETGSNKDLVSILDTIFKEDKQYRIQSQELEKKYGWESNEVQTLWKTIEIKDSIHLIKVEKILDEKGWLGPDIVGYYGNVTLFLVIQHADPQTRVKYIPLLRDAVKKGNARPQDLALMEDRVLIEKREKQIYGSQLTMNSETNTMELAPMIDPDNADKRRSEVGLEPLAEYLKYHDLTWDVEKFKKRMEVYDSEKNKK